MNNCKMNDYIVKNDVIIFSPHYNNLLQLNIILGYSKIIFSDCELCDKLFDFYEKNKMNISKKIIKSNFNQPVDNLPCTITHLTFGYRFNKPVDNLPCTITHLTFGFFF